MTVAKVRGSGAIIHHRPSDEFLFFLRDDKPTIPFPNMLDIIGGHADKNEEPLKTLVRELAEEITDTKTGKPWRPQGIKLFKQYVDERGIEQSVFVLEIDGSQPKLKTNEGQGLVWLKREEIEKSDFAYGFKTVILQYLSKFEN